MNRPLYNQMIKATQEHLRVESTKEFDEFNGLDTSKYIYSIGSFEKMNSKARNFCKYMEETYPEIQLVEDITPKHVQDFIRSHPEYSEGTVKIYAYFFRKIDDILNDTYQCSLNFSGIEFEYLLARIPKSETNKTPPMEMEDFLKLHNFMKSAQTKAAYVPFMIYTIGERSEEIASLRLEEIDLEKRQVHLNHCRCDRNRTIPINDDHLTSWENIKLICQRRRWPTVVGGISRNSIDDAVRKAKHAVGIQEKYPLQGCEAIRKLYATRRLEEEVKKEKSLDPAWMTVLQELGHDLDRNSGKLFEAYIGMAKWEYYQAHRKDFIDSPTT